MSNKEIAKIVNDQNGVLEKLTQYMESISYMRKDLTEMKKIVDITSKKTHEIEKKITPIVEFYNFAKIGKNILAWSVGLMAAVGTTYLAFKQIFIK